MKELSFLLFLIELSFIYSKIITTNNLTFAIKEASPGDMIELESGTYSSTPYILNGGNKGNPITIKAANYASISFTGNNKNCIFKFSEVSYISIEGPFELKESFCGIKALDVTNIKISGLKIYNMKDNAIIISGENNEISNNEIYECVLNNSINPKSLTFGWSQCISVVGKKHNSYFSKNILFKNNYIHDTWGESLHFFKCDGCSAALNNITNGFSMNIYIDASKNILIDGNILRITSDKYDSHLGNACGIGLSSESLDENKIDNVTIQNNIILNTRIGIYFFQIGFSGYSNIKILHNTIWQVKVTSLWFEKPSNTAENCELRNNLIYLDGWIANFYPKKAWTIGNNYYYNYEKVPDEYSDNDGNSKAVKNLDLGKIFNKNIGNCNYEDKNLEIECLRPSKNPEDYFNLFHGGSKPINEVTKDIYGCSRSALNPSIGAFEYYIGCTEYSEFEDFQIMFKINVGINFGEVVKITGDPWSWDVINAPALNAEFGNNWNYFFNEIPESFEYKFFIYSYQQNMVVRWESDPNRKFNLNEFSNAIKSSPFGFYENCNYANYGNLFTLICNWK